MDSGHTAIGPGVRIGRNSVIGAGSVVTKDIPANVVAVGNPCRVIRPITEKDREAWGAVENGGGGRYRRNGGKFSCMMKFELLLGTDGA